MNRKGFTLIELLATLMIIGIIFGIAFYLIRGTTASTLTQMNEISDSEIFEAAKMYAIETNRQFNRSGYVCVSMQEFVDLGYINGNIETDKIIKLKRNIETKAIEEIKYVKSCN